ncbi:TlpA family protein disulfide reductase [Pedobacter deserti]|uniref:TlpA family protein disulfide reductase n=1 Tax=Pedobacter deserti TaxID=2817382 RepID=UPI002109AF2E|nr:TlpA disulfide reductase family protein [Pedobacter sp. SYSU D00382]
MKKWLFALMILSGCVISARPQTSMLLHKDYVNLKGETGTTVVLNSTPDTLKLSYQFFNWFPYAETLETLTIPPGRKDSIVLMYHFPDWIFINGRFKIYNAPGKTLLCDIKDYKSKNVQVSFTGFMSRENEYYLAYQQFLGHYNMESVVYYSLSGRLNHWNDFPAKADSLTSIPMGFLDRYTGALPDWFKKHERRRLLHNHYLRLCNTLRAAQAYGEKKIMVDSAYYSSQRFIDAEDDMILNDTYVYFMPEYILNRAKSAGRADSATIPNIRYIWGTTDKSDVNAMIYLGRAYQYDPQQYNSTIQSFSFKEPSRKLWLDAAIQERLKPTLIKPDLRNVELSDLRGNSVSLDNFIGKVVIINFWGVWCAPCKAEFPYENKLHHKYKDKGLVVVNICADSDRSHWIRDSEKYSLQMVNLYSKKEDFPKLMKAFRLTTIPASISINREGKISDQNVKRARSLTEADVDRLLRL